MNSSVKITLGCVSVCLFGGFIAWRTHVAAQAKVPVYGIVADLTSSHTLDRSHACLAVAGLAESVVEESSAHVGAQLNVLALGDSTHAGEPVLLSAKDAIPVRMTLSIGEDALRKQRRSYTQDIYDRCLQAPAPEYSAVYLGVERMLEDLRSHGCGQVSRCVMYVDTDGDDNVERGLKERLQGASGHHGKPIALLDDQGIEVHFCGLAEANVDSSKRGNSTSLRKAFLTHQPPDHVQHVWRTLFLDPSAVSFTPFCPQPSQPRDYLQHAHDTTSR